MSDSGCWTTLDEIAAIDLIASGERCFSRREVVEVSVRDRIFRIESWIKHSGSRVWGVAVGSNVNVSKCRAHAERKLVELMAL